MPTCACRRPPPTHHLHWHHDVFGNQLTEQYTNTGPSSCTGTVPMDYGDDNRLLRRHAPATCTTMSRYWTDQAGNRLVETEADSLTTLLHTRSILTYTAANQLYHSVTPTASAGSYHYNWHWGACPECSEGMVTDAG